MPGPTGQAGPGMTYFKPVARLKKIGGPFPVSCMSPPTFTVGGLSEEKHKIITLKDAGSHRTSGALHDLSISTMKDAKYLESRTTFAVCHPGLDPGSFGENRFLITKK